MQPNQSSTNRTIAGKAWVAGLIILGVLSAGAYLLTRDAATPKTTWKTLGPFQVLGGDEECWLFLQVDQMIHIPGSFVSAPTRTDGHSQFVIVITTTGVKERIPVSIVDGAGFHPNANRVFRLGDAFYLFEGQSMGHRDSVFKWQVDHFELLPLEDGDDLIVKHGIDHHPARTAASLDRLSEKNGWKHLYSKHPFGYPERKFVWKGREFEIDFKEKETVEVTLRCKYPDEAWEETALEYDATTHELTAEEDYRHQLRPQQEGHRK